MNLFSQILLKTAITLNKGHEFREYPNNCILIGSLIDLCLDWRGLAPPVLAVCRTSRAVPSVLSSSVLLSGTEWAELTQSAPPLNQLSSAPNRDYVLTEPNCYLCLRLLAFHSCHLFSLLVSSASLWPTPLSSILFLSYNFWLSIRSALQPILFNPFL